MPRPRTFRTDELPLHAAVANTVHVLVAGLLKLYPQSADLQFSERCLRAFHGDVEAELERRSLAKAAARASNGDEVSV